MSPQLETVRQLESEPVVRSNGNAAKLTLSLRDVIFLLCLIGGIAGNYFATQARMDAVRDQIQDIKQDIRELRHSIEKRP